MNDSARHSGRWRVICAFVACAGFAFCEENDPAARWVGVYGWIQTGDRLAEAEQWALAMGSYLESHRQIKQLAAEHPAFEPELIGYRTAKLEEAIAGAETRLGTDEHEVTMTYLDFIESVELGQAQRFRNEFEAALTTLDTAKALLDELIEKKPEAFRMAVATQYDRLEKSISWLNSQIDYKEMSRRADLAKLGDVQGTTQFIKESDLPDSGEGVFASGILFPGSLIQQGQVSDEGPGAPASPAGEEVPNKAGETMRFRMSSKPQPGSDDPTDLFTEPVP